MWTLDKPTASLAAAIRAVAWMTILLKPVSCKKNVLHLQEGTGWKRKYNCANSVARKLRVFDQRI